jgi:hypothetical protein
MVTRLQVVQQLEELVLQTRQMTPEIRAALAQGRLECARSLFAMGRRDLASEVAHEALRGFPGFTLPQAPAFPRLYRLLFPALGFAGAERVATAVRYLRRGLRAKVKQKAICGGMVVW